MFADAEFKSALANMALFDLAAATGAAAPVLQPAARVWIMTHPDEVLKMLQRGQGVLMGVGANTQKQACALAKSLVALKYKKADPKNW